MLSSANLFLNIIVRQQNQAYRRIFSTSYEFRRIFLLIQQKNEDPPTRERIPNNERRKFLMKKSQNRDDICFQPSTFFHFDRSARESRFFISNKFE